MKIKKILITGVSGLLGSSMAKQYKDNYEVVGSYFSNKVAFDGVRTFGIDLNNEVEAKSLILEEKPNLIIHTAALANVDLCEKDPELARKLNIDQAVFMAEISRELNIQYVFISTDQLFGGSKPMRSEKDPLNPINEYARTKAIAEEKIRDVYTYKSLIIRTNFYGNGCGSKASFSDWALSNIKNKESQNYYSNIYYTPILMKLLNEYIIKLVELEASGIYNVCGSDRISKYDFVMKLANAFDLPNKFIIKSEYMIGDLSAIRPTDLSISCRKLEKVLRVQVPSIDEQLKFLKEEYE